VSFAPDKVNKYPCRTNKILKTVVDNQTKYYDKRKKLCGIVLKIFI